MLYSGLVGTINNLETLLIFDRVYCDLHCGHIIIYIFLTRTRKVHVTSRILTHLWNPKLWIGMILYTVMNIVNLIQGMVVSEIYIVILDTLSRGVVKIGVPSPIPVGTPTWLPNMKLHTGKNIRNNSIHVYGRPKPDHSEHVTMPGLNLPKP